MGNIGQKTSLKAIHQKEKRRTEHKIFKKYYWLLGSYSELTYTRNCSYIKVETHLRLTALGLY